MNAMANNPATTSAIGVPFMPFGIFTRSICSLKPANKISAKPKPMAVEKEYTTASRRLYSFCMVMMATPKIAQLVVIKGRNTPNAW